MQFWYAFDFLLNKFWAGIATYDIFTRLVNNFKSNKWSNNRVNQTEKSKIVFFKG